VSRQRRRCGLCGGPVRRESSTWDDRIAYCAAHEAIVRRGDELPPDPLERLPSRADELERELETGESVTEPDA